MKIVVRRKYVQYYCVVRRVVVLLRSCSDLVRHTTSRWLARTTLCSTRSGWGASARVTRETAVSWPGSPLLRKGAPRPIPCLCLIIINRSGFPCWPAVGTCVHRRGLLDAFWFATSTGPDKATARLTHCLPNSFLVTSEECFLWSRSPPILGVGNALLFSGVTRPARPRISNAVHRLPPHRTMRAVVLNNCSVGVKAWPGPASVQGSPWEGSPWVIEVPSTAAARVLCCSLAYFCCLHRPSSLWLIAERTGCPYGRSSTSV